MSKSSQWRHNDHDGVSNHQPHGCLLNRLFRCRSKKTSKLRVTGLCAGNSPVTGEFPAKKASNAEDVSIWWRHHVKTFSSQKCSFWLLFYGVLLTSLLWRCISWVLVRIGLNLLRPRQNGLHFADDIFKCIFFNENLGILIKISLKFVPEGPMNNLITLVWMMTLSRKATSHYLKQWWHSLQIHICVTRPQWVKYTDKNTSQWKCPGWDCCICCVIKCIFVCCCFSFLLHDLQ